MRLKSVLDKYHMVLDKRFGPHEVDAFFNLLIEYHLKLKRVDLVMNPQYEVSDIEEQLLHTALQQLEQEIPIQYILGETEFYGLPFKVDMNTLIPRPETEELVDWIRTSHSEPIDSLPLSILDIGTGSGCIAISLAKHILHAKVFALDVSEGALNVAKQNAEMNNVEVQFIQENILNTSDVVIYEGKFDIIVSNPPYVRDLEKAEMKPNVLDNEPHLALFVDNDNPLQFYEVICEFAQHNLKLNGCLYFEINEYLGEEMVQLMKRFNFRDIELKKDMFGKDRMVKGVK